MKTLLFFGGFLLTTHFALAQWAQIGNDIDGEADFNFSGYSVSLNEEGNILAIGATNNDGNGFNSGHVRVYQFGGMNWNQLGGDIDGEAAGDRSGSSVSLSDNGNRVAVGAIYNDGNGIDSGHVRVFEFDGASWNQLGSDIDGEAAEDEFGWSLSLSGDGNRLAVGAILNDGNGASAGHARVYQYDGINWNQLGADINGEASGDLFGYPVSLSSNGNRLAVGAFRNNGNGVDSGHVRIFEFDGANWNQLGVDINGEAAGDWFGYSVSLSGDGSRVAAGVPSNNGNGVDAGHVRVYQFNGISWDQLGMDIDGEAAGDQSGWSVSLNSDGSRVAAGAPSNSGNGADAGHVRVYQFNGMSWDQLGMGINGEASGDQSGWSVSLSGNSNRMAIGATENGDNGFNAGHVRVFDDLALSTPLIDKTYLKIKVYPNPAGEVLSLALEPGLTLQTLSLYNLGGKLLASSKTNTLSTAHLPEGAYMAVIELSNRQKISRKIMIRR